MESYVSRGGIILYNELRDFQEGHRDILRRIYRNRTLRYEWNVEYWRSVRRDIRALREDRIISRFEKRSRWYARNHRRIYDRHVNRHRHHNF